MLGRRDLSRSRGAGAIGASACNNLKSSSPVRFSVWKVVSNLQPVSGILSSFCEQFGGVNELYMRGI